MARPIITLTTDFVLADGFVGSMKGVIASIAPEANVVNITHDVLPPKDVRYGAYALGTTYRYFPADAIHVAVIDPGVGTRRRPIAVRTNHGPFVCPDNCLLSYIIADAGTRLQRGAFEMGRVTPPLNGRPTSSPKRNTGYSHSAPRFTDAISFRRPPLISPTGARYMTSGSA